MMYADLFASRNPAAEVSKRSRLTHFITCEAPLNNAPYACRMFVKQ